MTRYSFGKTFQFVSKMLRKKLAQHSTVATSHQQREARLTKKGSAESSCRNLKDGSCSFLFFR
jgi:hypothetical protein